MIIDQSKLSPMMKRYMEMKAQYPDCLLFFRLGDFYEMFFEDAEKASAILDLVLTGRDCGLKERAPMCGVPHHAVDNYIRKLIDAGCRVAICEQLSDPATTKGMLERDVVRVVTPGTVIEEDILDEKSANYLASVYAAGDAFGLAWADISTGEFCLYEYAGDDRWDRLSDMLGSIGPAECVCNEKFLGVYRTVQYFRRHETKPVCYHDFAYYFSGATKKLCEALGVSSLDAFECSDKQYAVPAAGGLYEYLVQTQKRALRQLRSLTYLHDKSFMLLDEATRRNLELTSRIRDGKRTGTLLGVLDKTHTPQGARLLGKWIDRPLQDEKAINLRLGAVETLVSNRPAREALAASFKGVRDLERLCGRLAYGTARTKELVSVSDTLNAVPEIKAVLKVLKDPLLRQTDSLLRPLEAEAAVLDAALERGRQSDDEDKGVIRRGYSDKLDELRDIKKTAKVWLSNLEAQEREETGIRTLKVGFNKVFGYYIEVSKSFADKVPYRYQRKQTLVGGERYITDELKEIETRILTAAEEADALESRIVEELKSMLLAKLSDLQDTATAIATLDVLLSFANVSAANGYVRPVIGKKVRNINITAGRHPVVETILDRGAYVPNDTLLDGEENRTVVLTGPNMAGKSTYMRQVALIVLMAHIGCFVPAKSAEISLVDRIFTRIGASDDLGGGQSTFMVEMIEVATILNYATSSSLLILDEIGRGTSTYDGLAIAWAVLEHITSNIRAKTLFATHFHELTDAENFGGVKNYRVLVSENEDRIIFLHKIVRGSAPRSFGVEVASLAGVKPEVVEKARRILKELEKEAEWRDANSMLMAADKAPAVQIGLFDREESTVEKELRGIDPDNLTPMQALAVLSDLKKKLEE